MRGGDSGQKMMVSVLLHLSFKFFYGETVGDGGEWQERWLWRK